MPALTTVHFRFGPTRKFATLSKGRWVADKPMRCTVASGPRPSSWVRTRWSSRSRVSARCAPRLVWATAWISSTITASTLVRISCAREVSMR